MNIIELVAYRNDSKLSRIKEAGLHIRYQSLNVDVIKSTLGVFYIDLIRSSIKEKEKNESLYDHISETLQDLDRSELDLAQKPLVYPIALASYLGFELSDNYTEVNRYFDLTSGQFIDNDLRHKHIINEDISLAIHQLLRGQVVTSKERRTEVLDALMAYYRFHIEGFKTLKSLKVLRTLLS